MTITSRASMPASTSAGGDVDYSDSELKIEEQRKRLQSIFDRMKLERSEMLKRRDDYSFLQDPFYCVISGIVLIVVSGYVLIGPELIERIRFPAAGLFIGIGLRLVMDGLDSIKLKGGRGNTLAELDSAMDAYRAMIAAEEASRAVAKVSAEEEPTITYALGPPQDAWSELRVAEPEENYPRAAS
jgi:hypothetical protein